MPTQQRTAADAHENSVERKVHQQTLHHPRWTYLHLTLLLPSAKGVSSHSNAGSKDADPDLLTVHTYITRALQRFLGLTGAAIPVDVLKHNGCDVWVRVPREDGQAVVAALGGWVGWADDGSQTGEVGWRVNTWGQWLGPLVGDGGEEAVFNGDRRSLS